MSAATPDTWLPSRLYYELQIIQLILEQLKG